MKTAVIFYELLVSDEGMSGYEYYTERPAADARHIGKVLISADEGYDIEITKDDTGIYISNGRPDEIPEDPDSVVSAPVNILMGGQYHIQGLHMQVVQPAAARRVPRIDYVYLG